MSEPAKISLDDLRDITQHLITYEGRKIKHIKSNEYYRVNSIFFKEDDMTIWFTYQTLHNDPIIFGRPIGELVDGRFLITGA